MENLQFLLKTTCRRTVQTGGKRGREGEERDIACQAAGAGR